MRWRVIATAPPPGAAAGRARRAEGQGAEVSDQHHSTALHELEYLRLDLSLRMTLSREGLHQREQRRLLGALTSVQ